MDYLRLDEICNLNMGQSPASDSYNQEKDGLPFFQGNADFGELYPVVRVWCKNPVKIVEKDTLLISVRAPIGALNFTKEKSCIGRGLAGITANSGYDLKYIYYALKYKNRELNNKGTGSTFKAISKVSLGETLIKNMTIEKQRKCVKKLDLLYKIIEDGKKQSEKLEMFVKSRFVEMFGDTVTNSFGWEEHYLDDYIDFLTSGSRGWAKYFVDEEKELFITIKNVKDNHISLENIQYVDAPDNKEAERTKVQSGDLLISITADLGRTGVADKEIADRGAYINQHLSLVRLKQKRLNPLYVSYFLESEGGKRQFASKNQNGVKAGLNFEAIRSLKVLVPPLEKQDEYLAFVHQIDKLKVATQKNIEKTQLLFDSLMQQYFGQ